MGTPLNKPEKAGQFSRLQYIRGDEKPVPEVRPAAVNLLYLPLIRY